MIGESDEYYGPGPFKNAYRKLRELYRQQGLSETEIKNLLVLDVKPASYFAGTGIAYQHAGGYLFCRDEEVMGWLFRKEVYGFRPEAGLKQRPYSVPGRPDNTIHGFPDQKMGRQCARSGGKASHSR